MSEATTSADHGSTADEAAPTGSALEVVGATKHFGEKVALDGVDLSVPPGSFCVLLGPSGSGKTTLLRCVAGIERLTSGRVSIGGRLVADGAAHRPPEQRDLSMVFQDYALWPHLSARRNVAFALNRRRGVSRNEVGTRSHQMLERVGLAHLCDRYPNELSGGEQQRVALARALVAGTGILLFDEPLSNLDADLRERMRIEISTLARGSGATSLYITHDQSEAFALADVIGVLRDGHLEQLAPPEEVYHRPATPFVARFTGLAGEIPVEVIGPLSADEARDLDLRDPAAGAGEARRGGGAPVAVRPLQGAPEDGTTLTATAPAGRCPAGVGTVLIRPAGVTLLPPGHADRHLEGMVLDAAYRGRGYDHALVVGDGVQLVGIHDERRWDRGDRVAIRLAPSSCLLFEDPAAPTTTGVAASGADPAGPG